MLTPRVGGSPSLEVVRSVARPSDGNSRWTIHIANRYKISRRAVEMSVRALVGIRARLKYCMDKAYSAVTMDCTALSRFLRLVEFLLPRLHSACSVSPSLHILIISQPFALALLEAVKRGHCLWVY